MDSRILEHLRRVYKTGTRVRLCKMDDPFAPPVGTEGVVRYVDDLGSVGVDWSNGSGLALVYGEDYAEIIEG